MRFQETQILSDIAKKMVLLVGSRQAGKTWLAKALCSNFKQPLYLNYDRSGDRHIIQEESWLESTDFLIFDEIHINQLRKTLLFLLIRLSVILKYWNHFILCFV